MKIKVAIASVAVVAIAVVSFAFVPKKVSNTYYYVSGTNYQRLQANHTTETDLKERTIISSFFADVDNWTPSVQSFTPTSDLSKYIGSITFEEEMDADGGADGALTLQEALTGVFNQYQSNSSVMQSSFTIGTAVVNIAAANAAH
jgi:hypothetical protein